MAQVDVEWPSEDEDFDVSSDAEIAAESAPEDYDQDTSAQEDNKDQHEDSEQQHDEDHNTDEENESNDDENDPSESHQIQDVSAPESNDHQMSSQDSSESDHELDNAAEHTDFTPEPRETDKSFSNVPLPSNGYKKESSKTRMLYYVLSVLVIIGLAVWVALLMHHNNNLESQISSLNRQLTTIKANPEAQIEKENQETVNKVSKLMQLPSGQTPLIYTVSNASEASKQYTFFKNAQNGDIAILYVKAGEAILYRPSTNKIILVGPLTFSNSSKPGS